MEALFGEFSTELIVLFIGFFAGFVDSIAGGGGLIALPGLLFIGLPPHVALGTNKLQSIFGTSSAAVTYLYHKHGKIANVYYGIFCTFCGAFLGVIAISLVSPVYLKLIIPAALLVVFVYNLLRGKAVGVMKPPKMSEKAFYTLFGFSIGFYDGFFGPGTGALWMFALQFFLSLPILSALTYTKVMNVVSNFASILVFAYFGHINYRIGFIMAVAQILGSNLGARLAMKKGVAIIRPLILVVVFLTIVKTVYELWF